MIDFKEILPEGEDKAMSAAELINILGVRNERELRRCISSARKDGQLICTASTGGYFIPKNKEEISRWVKITSKRAASEFASLRTARTVLKEIDGQIHIDDFTNVI